MTPAERLARAIALALTLSGCEHGEAVNHSAVLQIDKKFCAANGGVLESAHVTFPDPKDGETVACITRVRCFDGAAYEAPMTGCIGDYINVTD
jgi:hypothetical protein